MRSPLPVRRGLNVLGPFTVYRAIGRRPSAVYVDHGGTAGRTGKHRLWDRVFEEYLATPGDQLQDRQGAIMLVTPAGDCFPVQVSRPTARTVKTAFAYAELALAEDWAEIERLVARGLLETASIRRTKQIPFAPAEVKFPENQPLVVTAGGMAGRTAPPGNAAGERT